MLGTLALACGPVGPGICDYSDCPRPEWADTPPALGAVGVQESLISEGMTRKMAEDNGRQELARQIGGKVMGILEQSAQQVGRANPGEGPRHMISEPIMLTLHRQFGSVCKLVHYWRDCCTGEAYVLVTIDRAELLAYGNMVANKLAHRVLKQPQKKHNELLKKMEEIMKKEFPE